MSGDGDDFMWEGLACPPLEDDAFNFFDISSCTLDDLMLDDPLLEDSNNLLDDQVCSKNIDTKADVGTHGKGKVLMTLRQMFRVEKPSVSSYGSDVVEIQRKGDCDDLRFVEGAVAMKLVDEGRLGAKGIDYPDPPRRRYGNYGKGKEIRALSESRIKVFLGGTDAVEQHRDKKPKIANQLDVVSERKVDEWSQQVQQEKTSRDHTNGCLVGKKRKCDFHSTPMQQTIKMQFDHGNQTAVVEKKWVDDYESKFEASRNMLHKAYGQAREVKERRHIQVIDFQKPQMQQLGSKSKAKGKQSLRQKLMAMGTRKGNKKFPPYKMLCSCN